MICILPILPHDAHLALQGHPGVLQHPAAYFLDHRKHLGRAGAAVIDHKSRVFGRDLRRAYRKALEPRLLAQGARKISAVYKRQEKRSLHHRIMRHIVNHQFVT